MQRSHIAVGSRPVDGTGGYLILAKPQVLLGKSDFLKEAICNPLNGPCYIAE